MSFQRPTLIQAIRYRIQWAFEDQYASHVQKLDDWLVGLEENPIDAFGHACKYILPFLLPIIFFSFLLLRSAPIDPATGQERTARPQPRAVPRPGTPASIEYTRKLLAEKARQEREKIAAKPKAASIAETTTMMSAPATDLAAPLSTPYTPAQLAVYNGIPEGQKIFVAIKGTVFDVSAKSEMYGPGKSYHVFAGKDASRGLGMSSVKPEDATSDYSSLGPKELSTLESWFSFFEKRYNVVGKVVDA